MIEFSQARRQAAIDALTDEFQYYPEDKVLLDQLCKEYLAEMAVSPDGRVVLYRRGPKHPARAG
jgi:hypothetical protein